MTVSFKNWVTLSEAAIDEQYPFKAVFMAGGPGSGKTWVSEHMFAPLHFQPANSDKVMGLIAKCAGQLDAVKATEGDPLYDQKLKFQNKAMALTQKRSSCWARSGLPYVIDITGRNLQFVETLKQQLEQQGYDTYMVFVRTSLHIAQTRNVKRGEEGQHVADADYQQAAWRAAMANVPMYQKIFGHNFAIVDNDDTHADDRMFGINLVRKAMNLLGRPKQVHNPLGRKLIADLQAYYARLNTPKHPYSAPNPSLYEPDKSYAV